MIERLDTVGGFGAALFTVIDAPIRKHIAAIGESGTRARLAFRTLAPSAIESVAISLWQLPWLTDYAAAAKNDLYG